MEQKYYLFKVFYLKKFCELILANIMKRMKDIPRCQICLKKYVHPRDQKSIRHLFLNKNKSIPSCTNKAVMI